MKQRLVYAALAVLALTGPAAAQGYEPGALPPYEILTMLRSTGLDPIGQPVRRGANYVLRAIDDADREVRVVVSARSGGIVSVTPVAAAPLQMQLPRGGLTMGDYERMPPGYIPPGRYDGGPPVVYDDEAPPRLYSAPPRSSNAMPPPNNRAMRPANDDDDIVTASPPSNPRVIMADPDRTGLLPPPPERFPQRAAPAVQPKPKPVQRAAAAPPKQAPLPKPKPAATNVEAPPPAAPATVAPPSSAPVPH